MTITEKVAYIKGLLEGLALDETKPETKVIKAIVDALDDIALTAADTEERVETLEGYCDELDDDLALLEDEVYGDEDEDEEFECDGDCENCDEECDCYDDEDDCDGCVVTCPNCGVCLELEENFSRFFVFVKAHSFNKPFDICNFIRKCHDHTSFPSFTLFQDIRRFSCRYVPSFRCR